MSNNQLPAIINSKERTEHAKFSVEAALLEELGERLVAVPEVALTELIKNSYDADASYCTISMVPGSIAVEDDGNGMSEEDFLNFWMVIGTRSKVRENQSRRYHRKVSGSKGIGRLAVRFLGLHLHLHTVTYDSALKKYTLIEANFDWELTSKHKSLSEIEIQYTVKELDSAKTGTTLTITKLRTGVEGANLATISSKTLTLTTPIDGLEKPPFIDKAKGDPGFSVSFTDDSNETKSQPIQSKILDAYVARTRIEIKNEVAHISVQFDRGNTQVFSKEIPLKKYYEDFSIGTDLFIDIRYFPHRKGTFSDLDGIKGPDAKAWIKQNKGIAIIDNGFRIFPYGTIDDDWLMQNADNAQNVRDAWRSQIMRDLFPLPPNANEPRNNPLLYLPGSGQVYGAVFVATSPKKSIDSEYQLTPSMDRQGYLNNRAFEFVRNLARLCLELIAYFDHKRVRDAEEEETKQQLQDAEEDLAEAVKEIRSSKSLPAEEKSRLTNLLTVAAKGYREADDYRKQAQESLETMSLLGVLAGFMTHEFEQTVWKLDETLDTIRQISNKHPEILDNLKALEASKSNLESFLHYSKLFTDKLGESAHTTFKAEPQISFVLDTLNAYSKKHNINVDVQVDSELLGPNIPLSAYSGILLNLLTNAYKALITKIGDEPRKVRIIASTTASKHKLVIADNGVGIPQRLQKRIWEPLFTTTTPDLNPMGSGMGLGLPIVKRVVTHVGGKIQLCNVAPPGYTTAFEVELPA